MKKLAGTQAQSWRSFLVLMWSSCAAVLAVAALFIAIMDPHDHLFFSPGFARAPINTNQRFSYPALARSQRFDSLVIGTSTIRLLKPALLNEAFGAHFVNLAMNSATAYEQRRIFEVFMRNHHNPAVLVVGIDRVWCEPTGTPERYTHRPFPEWLYDENRWNDLLHVLNSATLEQAARQLQYQVGRREPRYGFDGYENFLPPDAEYDLDKARRNLYGKNGEVLQRAGGVAELGDEERRRWRFEALDGLWDMLTKMPPDSQKVLLFVPYHLYSQPLPPTLAGQKIAECKRRVATLARQFPNTLVLDFMIDSAITRDDSHYWDPLHYNATIADELVQHIKSAVHEGGAAAAYFDLL